MSRRPPRNQEIIDLLAAELPVDDDYTKPQPGDPAPVVEDWEPPLGPVGREVFYCDKKFMLLHGERFTGKTFAGLHRVIKSLYDSPSAAAACLCTLTKSQAILGGLWTKFQLCLRIWQDGFLNPADGKWYPGLGLEGAGKDGVFKFMADDARNRYVWVKNCQGEYNMAFLRSMIHGEQIQERIKSMEFTSFLFDELADTDNEDYFTKPIQQLHRIPNVKPQQYIGCCNPPPEAEDHWTHKRFFVGFDNPEDRKPKSRADYGVFHVPISDNLFVSEEQKKEYLGNVMEEVRVDPTAYDRLILGKWVKRPTGKGLFASYFRRQIHVRGDMQKKQFIIPRGNVIDTGYDVGSANTAISFLERLQTQSGEGWSIFDELALVDEYVPIPQVAPKLLERMNYWAGRTGRPLFFNHISDEGSFNQKRGDGTYDARKLEQSVAKELNENFARYPHLKHLAVEWEDEEMTKPTKFRGMRLRPCPKPKGSVAARGKMTISFLQGQLLVVSARCVKTIEMFENLPEDPDHPFQPPTESRFKHPWDAASYVMYYYEMGGRTRVADAAPQTNLIELNP
jgi:hypothetical protein